MKNEPDLSNNLPEKKPIFEIPTEGALGLLALGAVGVKAWKEKKKTAGPLTPEGGTKTDKSIDSSSDKENSNGEK